MSTFEASPIDPAASWANVQALTTEAPLLGGPNGPLNAQATALAARTKFLKAAQDAQAATLSGLSGAVDVISDQLAELVSVSTFGIIPDGVTNWEGTNPGGAWTEMLEAAKTTGVRFPSGYYATSINLDSTYSGARFHFDEGAVIGGVFHLISDPSPNSVAIASISRASNIVTVVTTAPHTWATGRRAMVANVVVEGSGSVDFNGDDISITVLNSTTFTYPQTGPNESGTVSSGALAATRPIKNVVITGRLTTTDRLGTINAKDCYIERCWVKSDPSKHSAAPGTTCRGAHLYVGTDGLVIDELVIDDASGSNTDAALAIDGNGWNPKNLHFGRVHIKDSDFHGVYLTGGGHYFGELRIDGFARGVYTGTLQDSDGATQSQKVKGFWANRCWDTVIDVLRTSQNVSGSRGYEQNQAVVDETGSTFFGAANRGLRIGTWYASNVRRSGITFGDSSYDSVRCNVTIGLMEIRLAPAGLTAGEFGLRAAGASGGSRVNIDTLRMVDFGANHALWTETTANVNIRRFEIIGHAGRALQARGRVRIADLFSYYTGGTIADPIVHLANPSVAGSRIDNCIVESASAVSSRVLQCDSGSTGWDIGKLRTANFANDTGTAWIDTVTRWGIHSFEMVGHSSTGVGVGFNGAINDGFMGPGRVEGFSKGFAKGTATFTRITGVGLNGNGNSTPTDLVNGSVQMVGCNGLTL